MTNQLTVCIDVEKRIAVVSRSAVAGQGAIAIQDGVVREAAHRSWGLALAAAAGGQFLAFTATATNHEVGPGEEIQPIFYPESIGVAFVAGVIVGVIACKATSRKKKD